MAVNGLLLCILLATPLLDGLASPVPKSNGNTKPSGMLPQKVSRRETVEDIAMREQDPQIHKERGERMAHLSEDQREFMSKQIMQAISELMNDCPDRDYQGWVDFGRRSTE
ncbi:hypothetical protein UPYG_G00066560 [Umbra pygmaea]|uniref:Gastrin/cholecystokinin peptide hormone domain-containing protein n=1 Tax=Umbra pygmaea TaxID=75934 RepID=A0ABD0XQE5_UMBPY